MAVLTAVKEKSTAIFSVSFTDEDDQAVTPKTATWTLVSVPSGAVVNSRDGVSLTPASSVDIVLSGDDLALGSGDNGHRSLIVEATYDSSNGSDLPLRDQVLFRIKDLRHIE